MSAGHIVLHSLWFKLTRERRDSRMKNAAPSIEEEIILECEKFRTFILMIAVGGFLGAYTYTLKGGVFCNAQTANFVMLAVQLVD